MGLFDRYVMVDWSAAGTPRTGADSIWIADVAAGSVHLSNPATRMAAEAELSALLDRETAAGRRVLIGFDFAFGYPRGLSQAIRPGGDWRDVWTRITAEVTEGERNATNRFHAAGRLNGLFGGAGPFWGNGLKEEIDGLPRKAPLPWPDDLPARHRRADREAKGAQEVWKLAGAGSVGSQALTGIAMMERLRARHGFAVWPFEDAGTGHVVAEVFPSLLEVTVPEGVVRDAAQVETLARAFAEADRAGLLARMLTAELAPEERTDAATMLGLSHLAEFQSLTVAPRPSVQSPAPLRLVKPMRPYLRDPAAIYAESFATVRAEARLDRFPAALHPLMTRLIHACGMVDIVDRLAYSPDVAAVGAEALAGGAPVLCDCEMVAAGIIRRSLPKGNAVVVTLNDPRVAGLAAEIGTTRSAAAVELWRDRIEGAVVAVGNAPTALFHLLELLDEGWPKPAAILGFPVGFVGAAESKAELAADPRGVPFMALRGRRGGSAMASAAVNALAAGLPGETG